MRLWGALWEIEEHRRIYLICPEEMYDLLMFIGSKGRFVIKHVFARSNRVPQDEPVACVSTDKLSLIAGKYVGKDDPVAIVRAQNGLPAVGEILAPFMHSYLVEGWMRGSHWGPTMPVGLKDSKCTVFDGPPRLVAIGLQTCDGQIAVDDEGK